MTRQDRRQTQHRVQPVKAKRNFDGVAAAGKGFTDKSERDLAAERRLQRMLEELEQFDQSEDDAEANIFSAGDDPRPAQRWSDETSGSE